MVEAEGRRRRRASIGGALVLGFTGPLFGAVARKRTSQSGDYRAPVPASTIGMVRQRILRSSQRDQLSIYSKSKRTHSLKSLTLLRPLTCQRHVSPGLTLKRRRWAGSSKRWTSSTG